MTKDVQQAIDRSILSYFPPAFSLKTASGRRDMKRKRSPSPGAVGEASLQQKTTSKVKREKDAKQGPWS